MSFFNWIQDKISEKKQDIEDRKAFLRLVEKETKPIKRAAYLEQRKRDAAKEGQEKAKLDVIKSQPQKTPERSDFGLREGLSDPYKYLPTKSKGKKK